MIVAILSLLLAQATPQRDVRPVTPGSAAAVIAGVVTSDEAQPRPLRRARVTVSGGALSAPRTVITADDGAFAVRGLPAGRYFVSAVKDGWVAMNHGATRPQRPGAGLSLAEGESRALALRLPRGAVITGVVTDVDGSPAAGVPVSALTSRLMGLAGQRRLVPTPGTAASLTDDRGVYRIYGLPAGEYIIAANLQQRFFGPISQGQPDGHPLVMAPVYHPGGVDVGRATRLTVAPGEERGGIDLQVQYVPLATVSGMMPVTNAGAARTTISMVNMAEVAGPVRQLTTSSSPEGRFTLMGVPPGHYLVIGALAPTPGAPPAATQWSTAEVAVDGEDVSNVALALRTPIAIGGRFAFEGARPAPDLAGLRLLDPGAALALGDFLVAMPAIEMQPGSRFLISGVVPGLYKLGLTMRPLQGVRAPIGAWWLKSIVIGGHEVLDAPLELKESTDQAIVTFSDQASGLSGSVRDGTGGAVPDVFVVAFSTDRKAWFFNSRRIAAVRADAQGRYTIHNLPPGDYRVVATTDLEQGEWFEAAALDRLLPGAAPLRITGPDKVVADLVVR